MIISSRTKEMHTSGMGIDGYRCKLTILVDVRSDKFTSSGGFETQEV
jgi:hypothetical protein